MTRTLVAGFGNLLRGDDGFGVEVIRRLGAAGLAGDDVELLDVGTGGIRLAQELLSGYDRLVVVDAMTRGGTPGTLYVLAVDGVEASTDIDVHLAVPSRALAVAHALGALPTEVLMIGCEPDPASLDDVVLTLSPPVAEAASAAAARIGELLGAGRRHD